MRPVLSIGLGFWLGCAVFAQTAQAQSDAVCHHFYDDVSTRAEVVFHDHETAIEQRRAALSKLFEEAVDIPWIARQVAGSYWTPASPQERQDYLKSFRAYMLSKYIDKLEADSLNGFQSFTLIEFATTMQPGVFNLRTQILQKDDDPVPVDYKVAEAPAGKCHIRDFTIEGVNLIQVQSDDVRTLGAHGGLPGITQRLNELLKPAS